jgi:hypothetical protein
MPKIDQTQSQLDAIDDARAELNAAIAACRSACLSELQALAKECSYTIKPVDVTHAADCLDDIITDLTWDALKRLDEQRADASQSLGNDLRSQGVA